MSAYTFCESLIDLARDLQVERIITFAAIENLFWQAEQDRSKAYELKQELDRLVIFPEYEDHVLDLFKPNQ